MRGRQRNEAFVRSEAVANSFVDQKPVVAEFLERSAVSGAIAEVAARKTVAGNVAERSVDAVDAVVIKVSPGRFLAGVILVTGHHAKWRTAAVIARRTEKAKEVIGG